MAMAFFDIARSYTAVRMADVDHLAAETKSALLPPYGERHLAK